MNGSLLGGFNHLEKYEFVNGKDYPIYILWKHKIHVPNHQPAKAAKGFFGKTLTTNQL